MISFVLIKPEQFELVEKIKKTGSREIKNGVNSMFELNPEVAEIIKDYDLSSDFLITSRMTF